GLDRDTVTHPGGDGRELQLYQAPLAEDDHAVMERIVERGVRGDLAGTGVDWNDRAPRRRSREAERPQIVEGRGLSVVRLTPVDDQPIAHRIVDHAVE